jgi:hypothetical protein
LSGASTCSENRAASSRIASTTIARRHLAAGQSLIRRFDLEQVEHDEADIGQWCLVGGHGWVYLLAAWLLERYEGLRAEG